MKTRLQRRQFLKLLAGAASGVAASGYAWNNLAPAGEPILDWPEYVEESISSVCLLCQGGCGIKARVVDGNLVKLDGNPIHPLNRGRLCPLGQAGLQWLYHPDRIKAPMKRVGGKGSTKWVRLSWEEAIEGLASQLSRMRDRGEAHSLVLLHGHQRGLMENLLGRFCQVFGTPNSFCTDEPDGMRVAHRLMQGRDELFGYDLKNANYILSFGCRLLDGWRSPVHLAQVYGYLRQERPGNKAKIVQIERRLSTTAARADEWIPIRPGAEGALALGMAYVLIREELYDRDFIEAHTLGIDSWSDAGGRSHRGFRQLVLQQYRPDSVSGITGVPVDTIIRLAKEFAANRPAVAIGDAQATRYSNGSFNAMAIHALNALLGSLDRRGGILIGGDIPLAEWPSIQSDAVMREASQTPRIDGTPAGSARPPSMAPRALADHILDETPYKVSAIFLCSTNPLYSSSGQSRLAQALEKVPLVVSFSSFMDDTTAYADLILPDHTYLEKWQDGPAPPLSGIPILGIAQPVVKPLYNTRHTGDVILSLARSIGGPLREALPWGDFKQLLKSSVQGIFRAQYGEVFSQPFEEAFAQQLQQRGWWIQRFSSFDEFWNELLNTGGWSGLSYTYGKWSQIFQTPSGKFEFTSHQLESELEARANEAGKDVERLLEKGDIQSRADDLFLPHYEPPRFEGQESQYPLHLNPFDLLVLNGGRSANLPWVQEMMGFHVNMKWDSWLEIHPDTARNLGISDGDWVWVESVHGRVRTRAKLYPGAMPDVVNMPTGLGHSAYGRWATDRGVNPHLLMGNASDSVSGAAAQLVTRVKVYKA